MKNIFFIVFFAFIINAKAQITLEQTYNLAGFGAFAGTWQQLYIVNLEVDSFKIVFADKANKSLKLYDLNHTLWKTISFAGATDLSTTYNQQNITYISQHLFDLDDEIEFLYVDQGTSVFVTQVINEDGTILFTTDQAPLLRSSVPQDQVPIYNTPLGAKMILSDATSTVGNAYVYGLAGTLTTGIKGFTDDDLNTLKTSMAYPNPSSVSTKIDYNLPSGVNTGELVFYDVQGKEVKRFTVDKTFNSISISTEELQSGIYYYNLQTAHGTSNGKKLITIK